jgi:hypothetical protein
MQGKRAIAGREIITYPFSERQHNLPDKHPFSLSLRLTGLYTAYFYVDKM